MHVHVCKPEDWKGEQMRTKRPVEEGGEDNGAYVYIHIYILIYLEMETMLQGVGRHHGDRRVSGKKEASTETGVCHHKTTHFVRPINK